MTDEITQALYLKAFLAEMREALEKDTYYDMKKKLNYEKLDWKTRELLDNIYKSTFWNYINDNDILM